MLIDKHNRGSKNHQRSIVTFLSLVLGVHFMPGLSEAGETQTEHCYTASSAEVCLRPHLIERLVDTDALRHALEKLRAPQRDLFLSTRTIAKCCGTWPSP